MPESFTAFLEQVEREIRWKRACPCLLTELKVHLQEQKEDFLAQGMSPLDAEQETLRQMGDPTEIGRQLDRLHRSVSQKGLLLLGAGLLLIGLAIQLTIRSELPWNTMPSLPKLLLLAGLGLAGLLVGYWVDAARLVRYGKPVFILALAAGLCLCMNGSRVNGVVPYLHQLVWFYPLAYALWLASWQGKQEKLLWWGAWGLLPFTALATQSGGQTDGLMVSICGIVLLVGMLGADGFRIQKKAEVAILAVVAVGSLWMGWQVLGVEKTLPQITWAGAAQWGAAGPTSALPELFWRNADLYLPMVIWKIGWIPFLLLCSGLVLLLAAAAVQIFRLKNRLGKLLAGAVWMTLAGTFISALFTGFVMPGMGVSCPLLKIDFGTVEAMLLLGGMLSIFRQQNLPITFGETKGQWKLVYQPVEE